MISIGIFDKKIGDKDVQSYAFFLEEGYSPSGILKELEKELFPNLAQALKDAEFKGSTLQLCELTQLHNKKLIRLLFIGLGKKNKNLSLETLRRAAGAVYRKLVSLKVKNSCVTVPDASLFGVKMQDVTEQLSIAFTMSSYHFNDYLTGKRGEEKDIDIHLLVDPKQKKSAQEGIERGEIVAQAINKARHWIDLPPCDLTPTELTDKAKDIAKKSNLKLTVFDEKQINQMGMGGLAAVSRGSDLDCNLVILEYKTKKKNAPTIAFVGKGITFDSGGLSLKPPAYMETMKEDMSGAAAVIATMEALSKLKPDVNVIGVTPLSENLPSGKATKPGDIVRFYNGKTAEVKNTDAEGRLILADALAYTAKHFKPAAIIDVATLTGACAYALGPFYSGLMSNNDMLANQVIEAGDRSGDYVWRLPMHDDYKKAIESDVADLANVENRRYMAGTITAAHFLENFVNNIPWVHLDIAGTAFNVPDRPYYRTGATGAGVRLLIDIALNWK